MNLETDQGADAPAEPQSFAEFEAAVNTPPAAKEPDDTNSGEVDPPAPDEGDGDDGDNGTVNDEGDGDPAKPKGKPVQERINEITNARREAERAAEEARRDAEYWKAKAMGGEPAAPEAETNDDGKPDPSKFEYGEADPDYIDARARWAADQQFEKRQAEADRSRRLAEVDAGWNGRVAEVVEHLPDFNEVVLQGAERGAFEISEPLAIGIKASPVGPDIAYHLAKDPAEASRISRLPITQQAYEFGKLEARMEAQAEARKAAAAPPSPPTPSKAPTPPANLARGAGGRFAPSADTPDFAAFEAMANGG